MTTPKKRSTDERLDSIEANQGLQAEALRLIMVALGIREKLEDIAKKMDARNGAPASSRLGCEGR